MGFSQCAVQPENENLDLLRDIFDSDHISVIDGSDFWQLQFQQPRFVNRISVVPYEDTERCSILE